MVKYQLVNPIIEGKLKTTVSADSPLKAAEKIWNKLSSTISHSVPKFAFSLKNISDNKMHNFVISEKKNNNKASYTINSIKIDNSQKKLQNLESQKENLKQKKQSGGKKKRYLKDDSSSSSSDFLDELDELDDLDSLDTYDNMIFDLVHTPSRLIDYWYYNPLVYGVDYLFLPNFISDIHPYIQIDLVI